jgi:hypothetical protein
VRAPGDVAALTLPADFEWKVLRLDTPQQILLGELLGNGLLLPHVTWPGMGEKPPPRGDRQPRKGLTRCR